MHAFARTHAHKIAFTAQCILTWKTEHNRDKRKPRSSTHRDNCTCHLWATGNGAVVMSLLDGPQWTWYRNSRGTGCGKRDSGLCSHGQSVETDIEGNIERRNGTAPPWPVIPIAYQGRQEENWQRSFLLFHLTEVSSTLVRQKNLLLLFPCHRTILFDLF